VFKELKPENELKAEGLSREPLVRDMTNAVQLRVSLSAADRMDLDETSAWPLDLVQSGGRTVGMVMPLIPGEYFTATHQEGQPPSRTPSELSIMIVAGAWASKMRIDRSPFSDPFDRVLILINLVYAVARLHKHRIVYGDLSLKNAVFSPTSHNVLLLDCDGTASLDDPQRRQLHSPYFQPPEILNKSTRLQDTRTDVYKLALCIVRVLQTPSRLAMQASNPDILRPLLGAGAVAVLRRALDADPEKRPTAKDLFNLLKAYHDAEVKPPVIHRFHPLSATVHRGGDVVLLWDVSNPDKNQGILHFPDGSRHRVDLTAGQAPVKLNHSGTFRLEVTSPRGGVTINESQLVQVFDLPEVLNVQGLTQGLGSAIAQGVPALPTPQIPDFTREVKHRPIVEIGAEFLPRVDLPGPQALLDGLSLTQQNLSSIHVVNDAMEALSGVANSITSVTTPDIGTRLALNSLAALPNALRGAGLPVRTVLYEAIGDLEDVLTSAARAGAQTAADRIRQRVEAQANGQTVGSP
jgi:hypothetical protein